MSEFYYADSSALIKRHIPETGSSWIKQEFSQSSGNDIITSKLSIAEVLSGLNRRQREASISAADYAKFSKDFTAVSQFQYKMMDLTDTAAARSAKASRKSSASSRRRDSTRFGSARQRSTAIRQSSRADFPRFRCAYFDGGKQRRFANRRPAESLSF